MRITFPLFWRCPFTERRWNIGKDLTNVCLVFIIIIMIVMFWILRKLNEGQADFIVSADIDKPVATISDKFLSITLDVSHWNGPSLSSLDVITLARALQPAYIRLGGSVGDDLVFLKKGQPKDSFSNKYITFTEENWDKINTFTKATNLRMVFGLNSLYRSGEDWDPTNAMDLLNYSIQKGYVFDLELGNEPNTYDNKRNLTIDPVQLAQDFGRLRRLLKSMPLFHKSLLVGPDVTQDLESTAIAYLENFMKYGSQHIDAMTFHHYYMDSKKGRPQDFVSPKRLNSFIQGMFTAQRIIRTLSNGARDFWVGETSTAWDSGVPGLSDTFLAGFMWLDKLGVCARCGAKVVMRQALVGGNYALLDQSHGAYIPNPDYWLTLLFKTLVGSVVLNTQGWEDRMRIYGHCTHPRSGYGPGSVTFYMMNLYNTTKTVSFSQFPDQELHIYVLSSGEQDTLSSKTVKLNGLHLSFVDGVLPALLPAFHHSPVLGVQPFTMVFVVIPQANVDICL